LTKVLLYLLICTGSFATYGQNTFSLSGRTTDKNNIEIPFVSILLFSQSDSSFTTGMTAASNGGFELLYLKSKSYFLKFHSIGFNDTTFTVTINSMNIDLGNVILRLKISELVEIEVVGGVIDVSQNGDTTEYNAKGYKVNPDANIEDLILKMPGITIDNGKLTANGESVDKVLVDGEEFFGNDALTAIQNLPADIVSKIQVTDSKNEQAEHSGFMNADTYKTINIITKNPDSKLLFGKIYGGVGNDDRYNYGGNLNFFNGKQKVSIISTFNNVNKQNFSSEDLLGINSKNGGMSSRSPSGKSGPSHSQSGNDFFIQSQDGINTTKALGINYIDKWGKKWSVNANYFYNQVYNEINNSLNRIYSNGDSLIYSENNSENNLNDNHRVKLKMNYEINDQNKLIYTLQSSFQNNSLNGVIISNSNYLNLLNINRSETNYSNFKKGYNINSNLLFLHDFKKEGRTLSFNFNTTFSNSIGNDSLSYIMDDFFLDTLNYSTQQFSNSGFKSKNYFSNLNFSEKLNDNSKILFSYNTSLNSSLNSQYTNLFNKTNQSYSTLDSLLSNELTSSVLSHNTGFNYQYSKRKNTLNIGLSYQFTDFLGEYIFPKTDVIKEIYHNFLPSVMWMHKFNASSNLRLFIRTSNALPSVSQLQEVLDNSNPQQLVIGNSNLTQQKNTTFLSRFSKTNFSKGNTFSAFMMLKHTSNYIGQSTYSAREDTLLVGDVLLLPSSQLTTYTNFDNKLTMRSFFTYGTPINKLKCNLNINGGLSYSTTPGDFNEQQYTNSTTKSRVGIVLSSNFSKTIDFRLSYRGNKNWNVNNNSIVVNSVYTTHNFGLKFNLLIKEHLLFHTSTMLDIYQGIDNLENNTPIFTNASIGYKWFKDKNFETKISVHDLFNQNIGISQSITPIYTENSVNQTLQRYYMLNLTYKFNKIVKQ